MLNQVNIFKKSMTPDEKHKVAFLKKIQTFNNLNDIELLAISEHMYERNYKQNEVVFFRNDVSQALHLVKEGEVALTLDVEDKDEQLFNCEENHGFGINSLIEGRKRDFNATITSDKAILYVIPQSDILELFEENPKIKSIVLENVTLQYDEMFKRIFKTYRNNIGFFELKNVF